MMAGNTKPNWQQYDCGSRYGGCAVNLVIWCIYSGGKESVVFAKQDKKSVDIPAAIWSTISAYGLEFRKALHSQGTLQDFLESIECVRLTLIASNKLLQMSIIDILTILKSSKVELAAALRPRDPWTRG